MDALLDATVGAHRHAQQLDSVAEIICRFDVGRRDVLDALDVDLRRSRARVPNARLVSSDELVGRVEAADVEGRIGLRVARVLRLLQHLGERAALLLHRRQDVVAGAVEDAVDAASPRCRPAPRASS